MKWIFFLMSFFVLSKASSFFDPEYLICDSKVHFIISNLGKPKSYESGNHKLILKKVAVLTVFDKNNKIAKLYPQIGIDSLVFEKSYSVKTDHRTYWELNDANHSLKMSCELKYE